MSRVVFAPDADADLIEIAEYIARDKPQAARDWLNRIRAACDTLATQPDVGESRPSLGIAQCRSISVGNYVIFFRAVSNGIEVARIIHGSRDMKNL
jgi:toxin ParE1/3/4